MRLDSEIVRDDVEWTWYHPRKRREFDEVHVLVLILVRLLDRDGAGQIPSDHLWRSLNFFQERRFVVIDEPNDTAHRAFQTDMAYESACIDIGNDGDTVPREVLIETFSR